jgi:hypothetical protein
VSSHSLLANENLCLPIVFTASPTVRAAHIRLTLTKENGRKTRGRTF